MSTAGVFPECDCSREVTNEVIDIRNIEIVWNTRKLSKSHVDRIQDAILMEEDIPLIEVFKFPNQSTYYLIDGAHRLTAYKNLGRHEITLKVIHAHENDSISTVGKLTCMANARNGRNYSSAENYGRILQYIILSGIDVDNVSDSFIEHELSPNLVLSKRIIKNAVSKYKDKKIDSFGHSLKEEPTTLIDQVQENEFAQIEYDSHEHWFNVGVHLQNIMDEFISKSVCPYSEPDRWGLDVASKISQSIKNLNCGSDKEDELIKGIINSLTEILNKKEEKIVMAS